MDGNGYLARIIELERRANGHGTELQNMRDRITTLEIAEQLTAREVQRHEESVGDDLSEIKRDLRQLRTEWVDSHRGMTTAEKIAFVACACAVLMAIITMVTFLSGATP